MWPIRTATAACASNAIRPGVVAAAFPSVRNIFTVRFVAVNPLAGGRNTFAYKLEGFNTRWYETSHLEANYSNLKPGHYLFKVRAANNDGRWNDEPATVEIRVLPMWWQTLRRRFCGCCSRWDSSGASWRRCWDVSR